MLIVRKPVPAALAPALPSASVSSSTSPPGTTSATTTTGCFFRACAMMIGRPFSATPGVSIAGAGFGLGGATSGAVALGSATFGAGTAGAAPGFAPAWSRLRSRLGLRLRSRLGRRLGVMHDDGHLLDLAGHERPAHDEQHPAHREQHGSRSEDHDHAQLRAQRKAHMSAIGHPRPTPPPPIEAKRKARSPGPFRRSSYRADRYGAQGSATCLIGVMSAAGPAFEAHQLPTCEEMQQLPVPTAVAVSSLRAASRAWRAAIDRPV